MGKVKEVIFEMIPVLGGTKLSQSFIEHKMFLQLLSKIISLVGKDKSAFLIAGTYFRQCQNNRNRQ